MKNVKWAINVDIRMTLQWQVEIITNTNKFVNSSL